MVTLGIRVVNVCLAYPQGLFHHRPVIQRGLAQLGPVAAFAPGDHIVNRGEGKLLMVKMTV